MDAALPLDRVEFRTSRRKTLWVAELAFLLVLGSGWLIAQPAAIAKVVGWVSVTFWVICLVIVLLTLVRPRLLIAISPSGVELSGRPFRATRLIPWRAIGALRVYRMRSGLAPGQRMLGIVPEDPQDDLWTAKSYRSNIRVTGLPAGITDQVLPAELEEIARLMQQYKHLELEYGPPVGIGPASLTRRLLSGPPARSA